ncbi:methionine adenosyltransferase 2 subunit beta-like [Tubulanus polymorphus]|uniref:methionine adenosyltransferase 2 subunit beta-like n=1 Tax=Tubulanus polymorphus TaxID=672921 RepID=UPI003DA28253
MATKKVLITGASGLLGRALFEVFSACPQWEVLGLAFRRTKGNLRKVDLTDRDEVSSVINSFKPDIVIHSAAERNVDKIENEPVGTKALNITATQVICEESKKIGAWVLFISSVYVFDGKNPPYSIDAECNPLNSYGLSKREGEIITLGVDPNNGVLRIPLLFNKVEYLGESSLTVLFEKVKDTSKQCVMSSYEQRFPIHCKDIAMTCKQIVERQLQNKDMCGYFHWNGNEQVTKYDIAIMMAEIFGISTDHIQANPIPSTSASRPHKPCVDCSRLQAMNIGVRTPLREGIKEVLEPWMDK